MEESSERKWWRIAAGRGGVLADDWLEKNIVTVGWDAGNFEEKNDEEVRAQAQNSQLVRFVGAREDGMQEGDIVIAYAPGKKLVIGVGEVGEARYEDDPDLAKKHKNWRDVEWWDWRTPVSLHDLPTDLQGGKNRVWLRGTLERFRGDPEVLEEGIKEAEPTDIVTEIFSPDSEEQVQEWVFQYTDELGLTEAEKEYHTPIGDVDVLADGADGEKVVIEIKLGTASDTAVGQLLGYMNALREEFEQVRGILIAEDFSSRAKYAVNSDDIELIRFRLGLDFEKDYPD